MYNLINVYKNYSQISSLSGPITLILLITIMIININIM